MVPRCSLLLCEENLQRGNAVIPSVFEDVSQFKKISFNIIYVGVFDRKMIKEFERKSELYHEKEKGILSDKVLKKKTKAGVKLLNKIFEKFGYFDIKIEYEIILKEKKSDIIFKIEKGQRYTVANKKIILLDSDTDKTKLFEKLRMKQPEYVDFELINLEKLKIIQFFTKSGFYFSEVESVDIDINNEDKTIDLVYKVKIGKKTFLSTIEVESNDIPKNFILNRLAVKEGDLLKTSKIEKSRSNLSSTGIFSSINFDIEKNEISKVPDETRQMAKLKVQTVNAPPRVIGFMANYSISEGLTASGTWQNKNFLKKGHNIGLINRFGFKEITGSVFYDVNDVFLKNIRLHSDLTLKRMNTKAYEGFKESLCVGFIKPFSIKDHETIISFLPTFERSNVEREKDCLEPLGTKEKDSFSQNSFIMRTEVKFNFVDNIIAPNAGVMLELGYEPYWGSFKKKRELGDNKEQELYNFNFFSIFNCSLTGYIPLGKNTSEEQNSNVISSHFHYGRAFIDSKKEIPFDKRFYGGGRNSIRSYGYQMVSELDEEGTPIGGKYILEACIEPRIRISEDFGAAIFFDVGKVSYSKEGEDGEKSKILTGGGFGVRYYTKFGPIRLDVGFPFNRRKKSEGKKHDKAIQLYISVGQAF